MLRIDCAIGKPCYRKWPSSFARTRARQAGKRCNSLTLTVDMQNSSDSHHPDGPPTPSSKKIAIPCVATSPTLAHEAQSGQQDEAQNVPSTKLVGPKNDVLKPKAYEKELPTTPTSTKSLPSTWAYLFMMECFPTAFARDHIHI